MLTTTQHICSMKNKSTKYTQINTTKSRLCTVKCTQCDKTQSVPDSKHFANILLRNYQLVCHFVRYCDYKQISIRNRRMLKNYFHWFLPRDASLARYMPSWSSSCVSVCLSAGTSNPPPNHSNFYIFRHLSVASPSLLTTNRPEMGVVPWLRHVTHF